MIHASSVPEPPATLTLSGSSAQVLAGGKPVVLTAAASANAGGNIARIGPTSFAVISGSAIIKLVLPP